MLAAIIEDIIGSAYERKNVKRTDFHLFTPRSRFTDDTVMTLAVAQWLTKDKEHGRHFLVKRMREFGRMYPHAGYGRGFSRWLFEDNPRPYNSWGNGSAIRVSPVGTLCRNSAKSYEIENELIINKLDYKSNS